MKKTEIELVSTDLNITKLIAAIKNLQVYKDIIKNQVKLKEDFLNLLDSNSSSVTTVKDNDQITVTGILKLNDKEASFKFIIKVIDTDQKKVDAAVTLLQTIKQGIIVLAIDDLSNHQIIKIAIKDEIRHLQGYQNIFEYAGVTFKNDQLTLHNSTGITLTNNAVLKNNEIITVKGIVQSGTKEQEFEFTIKVINTDQAKHNKVLEVTQQKQEQKIDTAVAQLQAIKQIIELATFDLNAAKLKDAIKNLLPYKLAVKGDIVLKGNLTLENSNDGIISDTTAVTNNQIITVKGILQAGSEEKPFEFTIKIKLQELTKTKVETTKPETQSNSEQNTYFTGVINTYDSNIWHQTFDSKNNMYFASYSAGFGNDDYGELYVLKNNAEKAIKINGIDRRIHNITIDNNDNVYLDANNGLYILKQGQDNAIKINNLNSQINSIAFNENKVYFATNFGAYVLNQNETTANKINELNFLNTNNKTNYFFINNDKIYVGCLHHTYILNFDHTIFKTLRFDSHLLQFDDKGNIYFGTGRGLYKYEIATQKEKKIKIKKNNQLIDSDNEITRIYFINNQIYFSETTREHNVDANFYKINTNDIAELTDQSSIYD